MITRLFKETKEGWAYWKLAIAKVSLKCLITGLGVILSGVSGIQRWTDLSPMQRTTLFIGAIIAICGVIDSFLDTTMAKLRKDHPDNIPDEPEKQNEITK